MKMADMCKHPWVTLVCHLFSESAIVNVLLMLDTHCRIHTLWQTRQQGWHMHNRVANRCTTCFLRLFCVCVMAELLIWLKISCMSLWP